MTAKNKRIESENQTKNIFTKRENKRWAKTAYKNLSGNPVDATHVFLSKPESLIHPLRGIEWDAIKEECIKTPQDKALFNKELEQAAKELREAIEKKMKENTPDWKKLKGKRILVNNTMAIFSRPDLGSELMELRVLDISASEKFVKTQNVINNKIEWLSVSMFAHGLYKILEVLTKPNSSK